MVASYAIPDLEERRAEPAARIAYFATTMAEHARTFAGVPVEEHGWRPIAMCNACGMNTGNWCDTCEEQGRRYISVWGQRLVGSPLCSHCEGDVPCNVCGK